MALTAYPMFGFPRQTSNFTLIGSNWDASFPVANLQNIEFARVARSTSLGNGSSGDEPIIIGTSASTRIVRVFGVAAHNMTRSANYRLRLYSDTGRTTLLYDSGLQPVWPTPYTYVGRSWYTPWFWTGSYADEEIEGQIPFLPIVLDQDYNIQAYDLRFYDPDNSAGYLQIGMLEVASGWQPSGGVQYGAQYGYRSLTQVTEMRGGLRRYDVYPPSFVFQGEIPILDQDETQNIAMEMQRQLGVHTPFIFIPHPTRPLTWIRTAKLVNFVNPGLFSHVDYGWDSVPLNLEEYKG